jgi:hypothetical protein
MTFKTDAGWTPSTYRTAHGAWRANAPANDSGILPRKAQSSARPRHAALADQCRSLLAWRAAFGGSDWTVVAENDNDPLGEVPPLLDSEYEIRPRVSEIMAALKDVQFDRRQHAKLDGGGDLHLVPVGGDMERGPVHGSKDMPHCVTRLGSLHFSNGGRTEWAPVRTETGIEMQAIRIPRGGLVSHGNRKARDRFTRRKGAANDNTPPTVGQSAGASSGAMVFDDPVADASEAERLRQVVRPETAAVLDRALVAGNMRDIGEHLGFRGKTAERKGKEALISACAELDAVLAA